MNKYTNQEQLKLAIFNSLHNNSHVCQRALVDNLNVSLGSINYCLRALIKKGFVKVQNFKKSNNKLSYSYMLTPRGISQKLVLTKQFLEWKLKEYKILQIEIKNLEQELNDVKNLK